MIRPIGQGQTSFILMPTDSHTSVDIGAEADDAATLATIFA